jgi:hypothetical protein
MTARARTRRTRSVIALGGALVLGAVAHASAARAQPVLPPPPPPPLDTSHPPPPPPPRETPRPAPPSTTPPQAPIDITITKPRSTKPAQPEPPHTSEPPPEVPASKHRLEPIDLADKREDGYFTGLPLLNSDPDLGVGFGARVYYYWNGRRTDPLFIYTPYLHRAYAQAFFTTNGYQAHTLDYDGLYVGGTPFRVRAAFTFEKNIFANYFGRGTSSLSPLAFPGAPGTYSSLSDYNDAESAVQAGTTYSRYDHYSLTRPQLRASIERDVFGGVARVLGGALVSYATVRDYSGTSVPAANGAHAIENTTRLRADCDAQLVNGCQDGWNNQLKLGIAYDTRDFEPDPTTGVFADATTEVSLKALGSQYDYARVTASPRVYVGALRGAPPARLVFAGRLVYSITSHDVPFWDMGTLAFTDGDQIGLGGLRTIRGYAQERFVGRVAALTNVEARWTFVAFTAEGQRFHFILAAFLDMGRVFDSVGGTTLAGWKRGQGGALRIGWNQATIVSLDYGVSQEGPGFYVNFGHPF